MTGRSAKFCLTAGYLMQALDECLTPGGRNGFFTTYGRKELGINPKTEDIEPGKLTSFFPAVTAMAISKGIPAPLVKSLLAESRKRCGEILKTPGALDALKRLVVVTNYAQNARRRARNN